MPPKKRAKECQGHDPHHDSADHNQPGLSTPSPSKESGSKKRTRRRITNGEALKGLKKTCNDFNQFSEVIFNQLTTHDDSDSDPEFDPDDSIATEEAEVELNKAKDTIWKITCRLKRLRDAADKKRKFKRNPELLDDTFLASSQSIFNTQEADAGLILTPPVFEDCPQSTQEIPKKLGRKRQSLGPGLSNQTIRARIAGMREKFRIWCEEEECSVLELAGAIIHFEYYLKDRKIANFGWEIFSKKLDTIRPEASVEEGLWLLEQFQLSRTSYNEIRIRFQDRFRIPSYHSISQTAREISPQLIQFGKGVRAEVGECVSKTLVDHLTLLAPNSIPSQISFNYCYGADGSGQHSVYSHKADKGEGSSNMMCATFALQSITSDEDGTVLWDSKVSGFNSPYNVRPLLVTPEKETDELLKEYIPILDAEVEKVRDEDLVLNVNGRRIVAKVKDAKFSFIDGKMIVRLLQIGGSYCTMCPLSLEACHTVEIIMAGFTISRTVQSIEDIALFLMDEDENIVKETGDYELREGVTGVPITTAEVTKAIPICHIKIKVFEWIVKLMVKCNSHKKWGFLSKTVTKTKDETEAENKARKELKAAVFSQIGLNIGDASDMANGPKFHRITSDENRRILASLLHDQDLREPFSEILLEMFAVVRVLQSQTRKIDVPAYHMLCTSVQVKIVEYFDWAVISPSLHRVLGHSYERIELNNGFGLGSESEEGAEALNKFVRNIRCHGARKTSVSDNSTDIFNHLWKKSSPRVTQFNRMKKKLSVPTSDRGSEIEDLVESLFCDPEMEDEH